MPTFSIFSVIAVGWENWRAFRPYVTGLRWANILTLRVCRIAARFLKKPPDWGHGVIGPYSEHSRSSWGFHLTVYAGFPLRARRLSIVTNGGSDLSLMGGCPASSHPKARHLSPLNSITAFIAVLVTFVMRTVEHPSGE